MSNFLKKKIYISLALFISILIIGVFGYMSLSGDKFVDALYMTVITITTVGFGTLHRLSDAEKLFTVFLILSSVVVIGYSVTAITEYLANGEFFQLLKLKKVQNQIDKLNGHTIVCGYGRNGRQAVVKLKNYKKPFVVVEIDKIIIEDLERQNILVVQGDGRNDETLKQAGIEKANSLITAFPQDADNLFVVLSARQLNKNLIIISRASNDSSFDKLKFAGATNVIMPDKLGGEHMASLVVTPDIIEFVDKLTLTQEEGSTNLEEVAINDLSSEFLNKSILDLDLRKKTGCLIIGFKSADQKYIINPSSDIKLTPNSLLIVLGKPDQIVKLREVCCI
tara:strand:- start:4470 stop:5480 length:1011 start_codon:yes stop_codon:yes gene_type:complete